MRIFNPRDYGARPNDNVDDTKAIQAALDAARDAGGGIVKLDAGTFTLTGTGTASDGALRIYSNTEISGAGMGQTILKLQDGWAAKITGLIRTPVNQVTTDVIIRDLTLDGNRDNTTADVDGIMTGVLPGKDQHDDRILIERVEIHDVSRIAFNPHEQTHNLTIRDCVAHHNSWDGFIADYIVNGVYENNIAYANDRHGFNVVTHSHDVILRNNVAYDNAENGIVVQRGAGSQTIPGWQNMLNKDILVEGNTVYNNGFNGILFKQAENSQIVNNTIYGNGHDGIQLEGANEIIIDGNKIQSSTFFGVEIRPYTGSLGGPGNSYDNVVINNVITAVQRAFVETGSSTLNNTYAENFIGSLTTTLGASAKIVGDSASFVYDKIAFTVTVPKNYFDNGMGDGDGVVDPPPPPPPPANIAPDARDDNFTGNQDRSITGNVISNDTDANGDSISVVAGSFATSNGSVTLNSNGTFTYTPKAGYSGTDSFTYTLQDSKGANDVARVNLTMNRVDVTPPPPPPPAPPTGTTGITLSGDSANNILNGSARNDTLKGRLGHDRIFGGDGNDNIEGNEGNDFIHGGLGRDTMKGGEGADTFSFTTLQEAGQGDVVTDFNVTTDKLDVSEIVKDFVGFVRNTAFTDGFLKLVQNGLNVNVMIDRDGSAGSAQEALLVTLNNVKTTAMGLVNFVMPDVGAPKPVVVAPPVIVTDKPVNLSGTSGNDTLSGGSENDTLKGSGGHDKLLGNAGNDTLWGNEGNDILYGAQGADWMKGGSGADRFIIDANLGGRDTIDDLRVNDGDKLEIRNILSFDPLRDPIADFVRMTSSGSDTIVSVDLNGAAGGANFVEIAKINGFTGLDATKLYADGHLLFVNSNVV